MKQTLLKQSILAKITFVALLTLLVVQVLFLVNAGKLEQKHFNHRVVLALREARNEIAREANKCSNMHSYVSGRNCSRTVQYINFNKVDSIIQSNLFIHKINLDYKFEFININDSIKDKICLTCYQQSLNGLLEQNGIKLQIEFPNQSKFLIAQIGSLFYVSIASILFVMISFFITFRLFKQKKLLLENIKSFIDNMVHELQTPIANIKFANNLIAKRNNSINDEKIRNYTSLIIEENKKLTCHVEDILGVAYLSSESPKNNVINIHEIINECISSTESYVSRLNGKLSIDFKAKNAKVNGNYIYLKHTFSNLIDNAIKYSINNLSISISTVNVKNNIIIKIQDRGIGIAKKEFDKIFEKYYRIPTGDIHNIKGYGIGLNFVKKAIEKHKGSIRVSSNKKNGTIFTIVLKNAK